MIRTISTLITSVVFLAISSTPATSDYRFEYTGTVRSVGGTVTDGSLLNFAVGEVISGSFIVDTSGLNPPSGTLNAFYPNSIVSFIFDTIPAEGPQGGYSYYHINASTGSINAYKQVGTGSIYDNFEFWLSSVGNSPFDDVLSDLSGLNLADFGFEFDNDFSLQRVDISSDPLRFTEVVATLESLSIIALPGPVVDVIIDIKPGSDRNSIDPNRRDMIPVAILTTDTFDATSIDPLSVEFGPNGAMEAHNRSHIEDINGDGSDDLVLHFRTEETGIQCGDTEASLTGHTVDEPPIEVEGSDSITTVECE